MINLNIVGLGQLGSNFSIEVVKRAYALDFPLIFNLYDDDDVESRNTAAQWFSPSHIGMKKVDAVAGEIRSYGYEAEPWVLRFKPNSNLSMDEQSILIDCTDNVPTRYSLWEYAVSHDIPLLAMGNSELGNGFVSWTYRGYDRNPFGLGANSMERIKELSKPKEHEKKMPPCELSKFRGLALNTALAAMESLFLFIGRDVCSRIPSDLYQAGFLTTWNSMIESYEIVDKGYVEWNL